MDGSVELYNLKDDLSEKKNLASELPEKAQELKTMLHKWRQQTDAAIPQPVESASVK